MQRLLLIALAGAVGTLCRYGVTVAAERLAGSRFPFGTLSVNLLGSLMFGVVFTLFRERARIEPGTAAIILVGFMGAFTTFSSYVADSERLMAAHRIGALALNLVVQNAGGIACFLLGAGLARFAS